MKLLNAIVFLCLTTNIFGQLTTKQTDISEIRKNKYQVDLGFGNFRDVIANTSSATLLFKKKITPGKLIDVQSIKYVRAFITLDLNTNLKKDSLFDASLDHYYYNSYTHKRNNFSLGIGLEKQFQNRRFVHYYGADLFCSYKSEYDYFYSSYSASGRENISYFENNLNVGVLPFAGIKYYLSDQLSLGLETGISLALNRTELHYEKYQNQLLETQISSIQKYEPKCANNFITKYLGLRFVTISYSFK